MTLKQTAYLTVTDDSDNEAVFEFNRGLRPTGELQKNFIMSNRGQFIQSVYRELIDDEDATSPELEGQGRRKGYTIDGGAGVWFQTVEFKTGLEPESIQWGDGSGNPKLDATGSDVHPITRKDIIEDWLGRTRTDSLRPAKFYYGEWTDGRFEGTAGAFNEPMYVSVDEYNIQAPDIDQDVNTIEGTLTISRVALAIDAIEKIGDDVENAVGRVQDALEGLTDF